MTTEDRVQDLLVDWLELREAGEEPSAEHLCAECPELLDEVRDRLAKLRRFDPAWHGEGGHGLPAPHLFPAGKDQAVPLRAEHSFGQLRLHRRGGLGQVFRAVDEPLNRAVALKRIVPERARDQQSRRRFEREVALTAYLEHPGIIPIYSVGEDAEGPFYTMPFISGQTLSDAIAAFHLPVPAGPGPADKELHLRRLLERLRDVCHTMAYAHNRGVIHRDLKPSNILLGSFHETLVVDWGMARWLGLPEGALPEAEGVPPGLPEDDISQVHPGHPVGTLEYMSPEQTEGRHRESPLSDVYSLGATLYHLLTGRPPFRKTETDTAELYRRIRAGEFPRPRQVRREVPAALEAICLKAMAPRPEDRYAGARELAEEIERWLAGEAVRAWREPWTVRSGRWLRRHPRLVTGVGVALVAAVLVAGSLWIVSEKGRRELEAERGAARGMVDLLASEEQLQVLVRQPRLTDQQRELLTSLVSYYQRLASGKALDRTEREQQAQTYVRIGWLQRHLDYQQEAVEAYTRALEGYQTLATEFPNNPDYRKKQADVLDNRGILHKDLGNHGLAREDYRLALDLRLQLRVRFPTVPAYRHDVARSYQNRTTLLDILGEDADALAELREGVQLLRQLTDEFPDSLPYRQDLAMCYSNLGNLYRKGRNRSEAEKAYQLAVELREKLLSDPVYLPYHRRELAIVLGNLGAFYHDNGKRSEAEKTLRQAIDIQERVVAELPSIPEYRDFLAGLYHNLGLLLSDLRQWIEAEWQLRRSLELRQALAGAVSTNPRYRQAVAKVQNSLGSFYQDREKNEPAEQAYREALKIRQQLVRDFPTLPDYGRELALSHNNLGTFLQQIHEHEKAKVELRQAHTLQEELAAKFPDRVEFTVDRAGTYCNYGYSLYVEKQFEASLAWYNRAIELLDPIVAGRAPPRSARQFLLTCYMRRALVWSARGRAPAALEDWKRAEELNDEKVPDIRMSYAEGLARSRQPGATARALVIAEEVSRSPKASALILASCASVFALAAAAHEEDAPLQERHAARAVALLRQAAKGCDVLPEMKTDDDLAVLRSRKDFRDLLAELEKKQPRPLPGK